MLCLEIWIPHTPKLICHYVSCDHSPSYIMFVILFLWEDVLFFNCVFIYLKTWQSLSYFLAFYLVEIYCFLLFILTDLFLLTVTYCYFVLLCLNYFFVMCNISVFLMDESALVGLLLPCWQPNFPWNNTDSTELRKWLDTKRGEKVREYVLWFWWTNLLKYTA